MWRALANLSGARHTGPGLRSTIVTNAERIAWIRENLTTRGEWDPEDYRDFYDRDVTFLLSVVGRIPCLWEIGDRVCMKQSRRGGYCGAIGRALNGDQGGWRSGGRLVIL